MRLKLKKTKQTKAEKEQKKYYDRLNTKAAKLMGYKLEVEKPYKFANRWWREGACSWWYELKQMPSGELVKISVGYKKLPKRAYYDPDSDYSMWSPVTNKSQAMDLLDTFSSYNVSKRKNGSFLVHLDLGFIGDAGVEANVNATGHTLGEAVILAMIKADERLDKSI